MKAFSRAINRFSARHPGFGIRNLMLYVIIGNLIVYLFDMMDTTGTFLSYLYFNSDLILRGQVWRLVTFLFIPMDTRIIFFAITLYFYYFIGSTLEKYWGTAKFTIYYLCGAIFIMLYGLIMSFVYGGQYLLIDATYLNLSMFFAFAVLFPDTRVLLFFFIPIKIKWLAIVDAVFFAFGILINPFPVNLIPLIAIANFLLFFGSDFIDMFRSNRRAHSKQAINFRKAARQAKREMDNAPYRHKCAVCGRTDISNPELEFRYCSRCAGYHCFCNEHINGHIHFTE